MHALVQPAETIDEAAGDEAPTNGLTPKQVQAAHLLALGHSYSEVCAQLSVGRTTLYRWRDLPEFTAYLNILLRQTADEVTLQATCLLSAALKLIKDRFNDPNTPAKERMRLALRLMHLYAKPGFLKFLNNRSDVPEDIENKQVCDSLRQAGHHPTDSVLSHPALRDRFLHRRRDLLELAQEFDAKYPDPADLPLPQPPAYTPAATPAGTPARTKMNQNGTSKQCSTAIDQALTGIRDQIAATK